MNDDVNIFQVDKNEIFLNIIGNLMYHFILL